MLQHVVLMSLACVPLLAQTQGVAPSWEVRANLRALAENTKKYQETVEQLKVNDWISQGAPDAYRRQRQVVQTEAGHLRTVSARLAEDPERLSLVVDTLFRLEHVESLTGSLAEAATRYQDPQAPLLNDLLNRNAAARAHLRQYLLDLTQTKEHEYAVAYQEAQRCMSVTNHNPLAKPAPQPKPRPNLNAPAPPLATPIKKPPE
ncbi:MAG: hypothetical protein NZV14_00360 [Bryobacteraceae bacterium]|nr:hypothetical protein [Bryobacteraceae bacterium]MDW8376584.1 hypothetical protein [Bryobacterales bacterium]